jgi:hypothetical protein
MVAGIDVPVVLDRQNARDSGADERDVVAAERRVGGDDAEVRDAVGRRRERRDEILSDRPGLEQDVEIWTNKAPIDNPLLSEEDGPVYQLRRWYQQFYVDVEDITEDMTKRFEFEIDTTRAVTSWQKEVAENLAKQAESSTANS